MTVNPKDIHLVLKKWHKANLESSPINHLSVVQEYQREGFSIRRATQQVISDGLELLQADYPEKAELLQEHFIKGVSIFNIANKFHVSQTTIFKRQKQAIAHLAEVITEMEGKPIGFAKREDKRKAQSMEDKPTASALLEDEPSVLLGNILLEQVRLLPPTYLKLVGVIEHLKEVLVLPKPPWLVSLEGIGGIGKTSLADALVRQLIGEGLFEEFAWVNTQRLTFNLGGTIEFLEQPTLTVESLVNALLKQPLGLSSPSFSIKEAFDILKSHLKERVHLIVIDNLETLQDISNILPLLRELANPTKFLLLSRKSWYAYPDIYHFIVPELSQADALQLVKEEAYSRHLPHLMEAEDEVLLPIYDTVGGNPLALRLIVGQTHIKPLEVILADLKAACGKTVQNLYTYIYRTAWDNLDEVTRHVFLSQPLAQKEGCDFAHLEAVCAFEPDELRHALDLLVSLNLVDLVGKLGQQRYTIHQLTRTFLEQQVTEWQ